MKKPSSLFLGLVLLLFWLAPMGLAQSIKPGTEIHVRLLDQLETGKTQLGQDFRATVAEPVRSGGRTILPRGTTVHGRVTDVVSSGRLKRPASISLQLTDTGRVAVSTETVQIDGKSHAVRNVELIGGGAAAGAILGGVAGGGKGAAIGTAVGAGAGTATAYLTGKQEIVLPAETLLTFVVAGGAVTAPQVSGPAVESNARKGHDDSEQDAYVDVYFSERQQRLIRAYFRSGNGGRGLPPGLAKRGGNLPPGLEMQLRRNGTLPPGLQKRAEPFPIELDRELPRLPRGYSRVIVSGRALILTSSNEIVDLMFVFQ